MNAKLETARRMLGSGDRALARRDFANALGCYHSVLEMGLESWPIHVNAAQCHKRTGDLDAAFRHFDRAFVLKRRPDGWSGDLPPGTKGSPSEGVSAVFAGHLSEQMRYLRSKGCVTWFDGLVERALEETACGLARSYGADGSGSLETASPWVRALVDLCPHRADVRFEGSIVSDAMRIQAIPLSGRPGDSVYVIDGLFERKALDGLIEQLLDSAIWFDARPHRRYLGAHLHDGLATPFMLDVAKALRNVVESLVGPTVIAQMWAFRYLAASKGIDVHADQGDWNLNVWPIDEAHMTGAGGQGGMTIYDLRVPDDAPFERYNASPDGNRSLIEASCPRAHSIPYAGNRAVVFPSRYLHKTNAATFSDAFVGRRINLTLVCDSVGS